MYYNIIYSNLKETEQKLIYIILQLREDNPQKKIVRSAKTNRIFLQILLEIDWENSREERI